jgi:histidinol phosphatase-like PHP family hydrolase
MVYRMIADYHVHTKASPDAAGTMADCVKVAKKKSIGEIGFSEHVLLRRLRGRSDSFVQQAPAYLRDFVNFKEESDLPIKLGIEIDFFRTKSAR